MLGPGPAVSFKIRQIIDVGESVLIWSFQWGCSRPQSGELISFGSVCVNNIVLEGGLVPRRSWAMEINSTETDKLCFPSGQYCNLFLLSHQESSHLALKTLEKGRERAINYQPLRLKTQSTQITFRENRKVTLEIEKHFAQLYISDPEGGKARQKFCESKAFERERAEKSQIYRQSLPGFVLCGCDLSNRKKEAEKRGKVVQGGSKKSRN